MRILRNTVSIFPKKRIIEIYYKIFIILLEMMMSFIPFWILFTVMLDTIPLFNVIIYCYTLNRLIQFVTHITRYTIDPTIYYRPLISPFEEFIIKLRITTNFFQVISQINSSLKIKSINERIGRNDLRIS